MRKSTTTILGLCILGVAGGYLAENAGAIDYNSTANVGFTFNEAISLSISGDIEIEGLAAGQQKDSNSVEITVNTNSTSGYILTASVGDSTHNNSDLSLDTTNKFASVATSASLSSLTSDNTWGYKTSENNSSWSNYSGLALYSADEMSLLREANARPASGSEKTYFKIGAKASDSIVSGDYSNILTFYAVAKVVEPVVDLCEGYQKMQDIATIKSSLGSEAQTQLCDARDGKVYWVAKLADGNIWMTQNLDYDIKADGTDIIATIGGGTTTTWNSAYPAHATETELSSHTTATDTYSWDPGDYYVVDGGKNVSTACTTWRPTSTCQGTTKLSYDLTSSSAQGKTELHYHLGNYYQWNTATAGYGGTNTSTDINYSICPKGWRLPTSNSYTENYSFGKLTNAYGITNSANGSSDANLIKSPLWFVRAGRVFNGGLYGQGTSGYVWSSWASGTSYAYYLYFLSTYVSPFNSDPRYSGYSVRCVAE